MRLKRDTCFLAVILQLGFFLLAFAGITSAQLRSPDIPSMSKMGDLRAPATESGHSDTFRVVARLDDQIFTSVELEKRLAQVRANYPDLPPDQLPFLRKRVMGQMLEEIILAQVAESESVVVAPEELDKAVNEAARADSALTRALQTKVQSPEIARFRRQVKQQIMVQKLTQKKYSLDAVALTQEEMKAYLCLLSGGCSQMSREELEAVFWQYRDLSWDDIVEMFNEAEYFSHLSQAEPRKWVLTEAIFQPEPSKEEMAALLKKANDFAALAGDNTDWDSLAGQQAGGTLFSSAYLKFGWTDPAKLPPVLRSLLDTLTICRIAVQAWGDRVLVLRVDRAEGIRLHLNVMELSEPLASERRVAYQAALERESDRLVDKSAFLTWARLFGAETVTLEVEKSKLDSLGLAAPGAKVKDRVLGASWIPNGLIVAWLDSVRAEVRYDLSDPGTLSRLWRDRGFAFKNLKRELMLKDYIARLKRTHWVVEALD